MRQQESTGLGGSRSLTMPVCGCTPLACPVTSPPPRRSVAYSTYYCTRQSVCLARLAKDHGPSSPSPVLAKLPGPSDMFVTHTLFRVRGGPRSVTPPYKPPSLLGPLLPASTGFRSWPIPYFSGFDPTRFLLHLIFSLPFRTIVRASPLTVLSGIILSFLLGDLPIPGHGRAALSLPQTPSSLKPAIPSLVIAESSCYMRKRGRQA